MSKPIKVFVVVVVMVVFVNEFVVVNVFTIF